MCAYLSIKYKRNLDSSNLINFKTNVVIGF